MTMNMSLTAVFLRVPEGYIGFAEEMPGANAEGATLEMRQEQIWRRRSR
jgi:hypothetical protein